MLGRYENPVRNSNAGSDDGKGIIQTENRSLSVTPSTSVTSDVSTLLQRSSNTDLCNGDSRGNNYICLIHNIMTLNFLIYRIPTDEIVIVIY